MRYPTGGENMPHGLVYDPLVFVSIDEDGTVTIVAHRAEMGTGSRTSLPMVLADEMGADWSRVKLVQAEGDEPKYGNQDTDGSRSMRHHIQSMRQMGASVRTMLAIAAAKHWGLDISNLGSVEQWAPPESAAKPGMVEVGVHEVRNLATGDVVGFGELASTAMDVPVPKFEDLNFKDESQFRYIGKGEVGIYDLHDITTGKAVYGADVVLPGMKTAAIARPPAVGSRPKRYDATATRKVPGVEQVLGLPISVFPAKFAPLGGIAVIASNTDAAIKGRDLLEIEWQEGPHSGYDSEAYMAEMRETAKKPGKVLRQEGDPKGAFANAAKVFAQEYSQDHMAHAPMEPPVAIADVKPDRAEIWAPVQSPYGTREDVAAALNLPIEDVQVNVTLLGGGFGRKSKCDFVIEAALLSQKIGAPVRVQWTREDDIQHSFYHTTSVERIEVALDGDDKVVGWRHNSVAPSILSTFAPDSGHQFFIENGMGHVDVPFEIPNVSVENGEAMAHTRIGWFRSVSNIPRAWAIQSFSAELADELGKDQLEMMLELIGSDRILDPAAQGFPRGLLGLWRGLRGVPDRHCPPEERAQARGREGRLGPEPAGRRGDRPRLPPLIRHLCRHRAEGEDGRWQDHGARGAHGDRLRLCRQPGADPQPDGGCRGHGHDAGALQRRDLREWGGGAVELPRLPGGAVRELSEERAHPYRPAPVFGARLWRWRAGRAADRSGHRQCRLQCDGQAHPASADGRRSLRTESPREGPAGNGRPLSCVAGMAA